MSDRQTAMWERAREEDRTLLETGGAVVTVRLSPDEVTFLRPYAPTLVEAVHIALIAAKNLIAESARPDDRVNAPQRDPLDSGATQPPEVGMDATTPVTEAPTGSDGPTRLSAAPDGPHTPESGP